MCFQDARSSGLFCIYCSASRRRPTSRRHCGRAVQTNPLLGFPLSLATQSSSTPVSPRADFIQCRRHFHNQERRKAGQFSVPNWSTVHRSITPLCKGPPPLSFEKFHKHTVVMVTEHQLGDGQDVRAQPPRKRRRIVISCTECHRRKQKVRKAECTRFK